MEKFHSDYKAHVFVCTNDKKSDGGCAAKNSEEIRSRLKEWTKDKPEWKHRIRVNASGCLDQCKHGVAIAIYPQNKWFKDVKLSDLDDLKLKIEKLMDES